MSGVPAPSSRRGGPRRRRSPPNDGSLLSLDRLRIERALPRRERYKYVQPRVEPEGEGWKIVSPNCSRNIDAQGGDINIAWFSPNGQGRWLLYARDHVQQRWVLRRAGLTLADALVLVCADTDREYWQ